MGLQLLFGSIFGVVGLSYMVYGKKAGSVSFAIFGLFLSMYTLFVYNVIYIILLGVIFTAAPFLIDRYF